jgi:hypothetical protein
VAQGWHYAPPGTADQVIELATGQTPINGRNAEVAITP